MNEQRTGRGFAGMEDVQQRAIASRGGRAAHQRGTAHEFNSEQARIAGRKGGLSVSQKRAHMVEIGRRGGRARGQKLQQEALSLARKTPPLLH